MRVLPATATRKPSRKSRTVPYGCLTVARQDQKMPLVDGHHGRGDMLPIKQKVLETVFRRLVKRGRLVVTWPDGATRSYGPGSWKEARCAIRDNATVGRLLVDPELAVGESYMDGGLQPIGCDIYEVLEIFAANTSDRGPPMMELRAKYKQIVRRFVQNNTPRRAHRNVTHHYDLN